MKIAALILFGLTTVAMFWLLRRFRAGAGLSRVGQRMRMALALGAWECSAGFVLFISHAWVLGLPLVLFGVCCISGGLVVWRGRGR